MRNISVIGAGYVGLVTAVCLAELGNKVTLIEIDRDKVHSLENGIMPVTEQDLPEFWHNNREKGRLDITSDYTQGLRDAEFVFITVGTPSSTNGRADLKYVRSAARSIARAASLPMIVVIKSTVPVGTADLVAGILARYGLNKTIFPVVSNPEFLREGIAIFDFMHPTRVVVGATDEKAARSVAELYTSIDSPQIMCDNKTAEMSKYASNVFLATRISFINEIASLCDSYGIDVTKVAKVTGMEPRCGEGYLGAGLGWGGSCLPKDVRGLIYMAKTQRVPLPLVRAVKNINERQPQLAIEKIRRLIGELNGKTIGLLGLSFKPNSDDMREATSLSIISLLLKEGCTIKAYDPVAIPIVSKLISNITYCRDAYQVAAGSNALILVTDWDEFKTLDFKRIAASMKQPVLLDGRNLLDPDKLTEANMIYEGIGRHGLGGGKPEALLTGGSIL